MRTHLHRHPPHRRPRRGLALMLVLVVVLALGALAMSAIWLASSASVLSKGLDREREFKYVAEAALAAGRSRLNNDPTVLPVDTGYVTLATDATLTGADNQAIPGLSYNVYAGRSGFVSGQYGNFASIVAEARDGNGARFVRRLEVLQESFAKFAYFSNDESIVSFGGGDILFGPVWSNDDINILASGATFNDQVGTAGTVTNSKYGTYKKGFQTKQAPIPLPVTKSLGAKLRGYATPAGFAFTAPNSGGEASVLMRIEFIAFDVNADGDSADVNEGYFRVYTANVGNAGWLRGDVGTKASNTQTCGDWHRETPGGPLKFFPASVHSAAWFQPLLVAGGMTAAQAKTEALFPLDSIMSHPNARCFLGGDPHLAGVEDPAWKKGGDANSFVPNGKMGAWTVWSNTPDTAVVTARGTTVKDQNYLFPLYRGQNSASKGVIHVAGTVGVSGMLRGRVTFFSTANVVLLDDMRYSLDPAANQCRDILGLIGGNDVVVADNRLNTPGNETGAFLSYDDTPDFYLHAVIMALGTSFRAENYGLQTSAYSFASATGCQPSGRGCLYLSGGVIQDVRGAVGVSSGKGVYGFVKRYSYDRCAATNPPPYFPTTSRFTDNRFYEIDPVRFDVKTLFAAVQKP